MNKQEVFNRVYRHLLAQGARSQASDSPGCAYRGEKGRMCAVGCLIDDEHYDEHWNTSAVGEPEVLTALGASLHCEIYEGDLPFLSDLQYVHDHENPLNWRPELDALARKHGLATPDA